MEDLMESYQSESDTEVSKNEHKVDDNMNVDDSSSVNQMDESSRKRLHEEINSPSDRRTSSAGSGSISTKDKLKDFLDNLDKATIMKMKDFTASCDYIPMRLTSSERLQLTVLENALEVCEYTDVVDVAFSHTRKNKYTRILESLIDTLSISCGLLTSNNLHTGEDLLSKTLTENVPLFKDLFEIGRRYKIMNPSKMRNTYGKLMYLLMDVESHLVKNELKINFVKSILTISKFMNIKGSIDMIKDPLLYLSTHVYTSNTSEIQVLAKQTLFKRYVSDKMSQEDLQRIIDSINDNEAYKVFNVQPVKYMLKVLHDSYDPNRPKDDLFSLDLSSRRFNQQHNNYNNNNSNNNNNGTNIMNNKFLNNLTGGLSSRYFGGGACLNHDHKTQFTFVKQSLSLWHEIMYYMPKLWLLADSDMTNEPYRLVDTGQGYHRLQACPRVGNEMRRILSHVQSQTSSWVGLSVIHLGDRDVPNALVFIDKYTQVPRILKPIAECISRLPDLVDDSAFHEYVSTEWGSISGLRMQILTDFFKHGFDGSGDDGGSCIDGRLTSAWNWCSKLHKKPYYHVFMFTGFQGFDGDWKED